MTAAPAGPPVANNDTATTDKNTAINISVLANDTDPAGKTLTVAAVNTTGTKGTVTINSDNTIHYDPNGQFAGLTAGQTATDTFTYTATDGTQTSNAATVTVTITGTNTAPVISNVETTPLSYQSGSAPVAVTSTLTASDADDATLSGATVAITSGLDPGADTLAFTNQNGITGSYNATTGVLTLTGNASLANYQAALRSVEFSTTDPSASPAARTASFTVTDSVGATSAAATRTIDVTAGAKAPTATNDSYTAVGNTPLGVGTTPAGPAATVSGSVLANDTDPNASCGTLSVTSNTAPAHGSVTMNPNGIIHLPAGRGLRRQRHLPVHETAAPAARPPPPPSRSRSARWSGTSTTPRARPGTAKVHAPFNTLAAANAAAGASSIIFVYQGSGTYSGGLTMKSGAGPVGPAARPHRRRLHPGRAGRLQPRDHQLRRGRHRPGLATSTSSTSPSTAAPARALPGSTAPGSPAP